VADHLRYELTEIEDKDVIIRLFNHFHVAFGLGVEYARKDSVGNIAKHKCVAANLE
jgi:hypothetical protein